MYKHRDIFQKIFMYARKTELKKPEKYLYEMKSQWKPNKKRLGEWEEKRILFEYYQIWELD
jgi:hypothetical protein